MGACAGKNLPETDAAEQGVDSKQQLDAEQCRTKVLVLPAAPVASVILTEHIALVVRNCQPSNRDVAAPQTAHTPDSPPPVCRGEAHDVIQHGLPRPPSDASRQAVINPMDTDLTAQDTELSMICEVITRLFGYKYSALALFAESRVWVAGSVDIPLDHIHLRISAWPWDLLVARPTTMVCEDLLEDARFEHQPWKQAGWRTYIASPLIASNGHRVGAVCALDDGKHRVDAGCCRLLNNIAEVAVREVEVLASKLRHQDTARLAYSESQQEFQRDTSSAHGACILLLDTSVPGWRVLYTNRAWEEWTGVFRELVVGQPLASIVESALDGSPLRLQDYVECVRRGRHLVIPKLQARAGGSAAVAAGRSTTFDLSFRSAALEAMDNDTLPIDIPSFVDTGSSMTHIYIARMHAVNTSVPITPLGTAGKMSTSQVSPYITAPLLIYGLKLGHIIGRGGYGTVYTAMWQDNRVAAKIQDYLITSVKERQEAELEINLGQVLQHNNIVSTLAHASVELGARCQRRSTSSNFLADNMDEVTFEVSSNGSAFSMVDVSADSASSDDVISCLATFPDGSFRTGYTDPESVTPHVMGMRLAALHRSNSHATASVLRFPHEIRAIQILEFCDGGCLQDAVDRGWLRSTPSLQSGPNILAVLATALDVAAALQYMHDLGVVHGDLTALNILLKRYGDSGVVKACVEGQAVFQRLTDKFGREFHAKVADFGKSRRLGAAQYIITSSCGTITHMAPEMLASHTLSRAADVFSFGVLLWSMWTGANPWAGLTHQHIVAAVTSNAQFLAFPVGTPDDIAQLGTRCLAQRAADRPPVGEVLRDLQAMLTRRGVAAAVDGACDLTVLVL